jgi:hypothetical protein
MPMDSAQGSLSILKLLFAENLPPRLMLTLLRTGLLGILAEFRKAVIEIMAGGEAANFAKFLSVSCTKMEKWHRLILAADAILHVKALTLMLLSPLRGLQLQGWLPMNVVYRI